MSSIPLQGNLYDVEILQSSNPHVKIWRVRVHAFYWSGPQTMLLIHVLPPMFYKPIVMLQGAGPQREVLTGSSSIGAKVLR
jgi:hypothetical protein